MNKDTQKSLANSPKKASPSDENKKLLDELRRRFSVFGFFKPLRIGIHRSVHAEMGGVSQKKISDAIRLHTGDQRYLKALASGGPRFNLDGSRNGVVPEAHQQRAKDELSRRFRSKRLAQPNTHKNSKRETADHKPKLAMKLIRIVRRSTGYV